MNKWHLTQENVDMANKWKPCSRNWMSSNSSKKQRHRNNYIKAKIDKTQQNRCRLSGKRNEMINHIREWSNLTQKEYKTRHDWVWKVIYWELCKKLKSAQTNKWYMDNPESVLENETQQLFWDFMILMDHQISARRPDLIITNKKENLQNCGLCSPGGP